MPQTTERFEGRVVLVTGASRGIGRACAQRFADEGARVAVHYARDAQAARDTTAALAGSGHRSFRADLGDPDAVERLADEVGEVLGDVDVLVNNAGIFVQQGIDELDFSTWREYWEDTLNVNLSGAAHLSFLIGRRMIARGFGRIINISSRGAYRGEPDALPYGASKAGLNAFSQSLAQALAPHGVYVFAVAPGFVETDMARELLEGPDGDAIRAQSPLNRAARPEEIAHTVAFLAAEGSEYLTGAVLDVNGASYLR